MNDVYVKGKKIRDPLKFFEARILRNKLFYWTKYFSAVNRSAPLSSMH